MIRNCRYTGQGFNSPHLHQIYGGVTDSTGMTMVESRLLGAATAQKLQTINWKRLCITNGCLIGKPEFGQYLSTETAHFSCSPRVIVTQVEQWRCGGYRYDTNATTNLNKR